MSRGSLFATMTVGMAGVAGTVLTLYVAMLEPTLPGAAGHLIVASVISVPAGLMISELMVPDHTIAAVGEDGGERLCQFREPRHHDRRNGGDGAGRRAEIVSLGAKTLISGTLAALMTAAVVGAMKREAGFGRQFQPDWPTPSSFGRSARVATVQLGWPGSRSARAP